MIQVIEKIDIGTGVALEFVRQGRGTSDPIICLHGVTDSWRSFEPVLATLSPDIEAIAVSQRGHGDSDRPASGYDLSTLAADVAAFMRALGIERAVLVGHSMGAMVAEQLAIDFPGMVSGLVLIGPMANMAALADLQEFYKDAIHPLGEKVDPALAREFQEGTLAQLIDPAMLDMVIAECLKAPARVWKAAFAGFKDENLIPGLTSAEVPAVILWGNQDNFVPRTEVDAIAAALRANLVVFEGHGHAVHWEIPELIAREIESFVSAL